MLRLLINFLLINNGSCWNTNINHVRELSRERFWKDPHNLKCLTQNLTPTKTTYDALRSILQLEECLFGSTSILPSLRADRFRRDFDFNELEYVIKYLTEEKLILTPGFNGTFPSFMVADEITSAVSYVSNVFGMNIWGQIRYAIPAINRLSELIRFLDIEEFSSTITNIQTNLTINQITQQFSDINFASVPTSCCSNGTDIELLLNAYEIFTIVMAAESNGFSEDDFIKLRALLEFSFGEFASQTLTLIIEGYVLALAQGFQLDETSYYLPVEQFVTSIFNLAINVTDLPPEVTIELYANMIINHAEQSIVNQTDIVEVFQPVLSAISGMLSSNNSVLFKLQAVLFLHAASEITLTDYNDFILAVYGTNGAILAYSAGGVYLLADLIQLHIGIVQFDLLTCEPNNTRSTLDDIICESGSVFIESYKNENYIAFVPEIMCKIIFEWYGIMPQNDDLCSTETAELYRAGLSSGNGIDAALRVTSEILKEIDARSGSAYADIQQNAINFVCVFADCTDEFILYYKIPELVAIFQSIPEIMLQNVNPLCLADFEIVLNEIPKANFGALKMVDAWGKIPSGILDGNLKAWGRSDLCFATTIKPFDTGNEISTDYCLSNIATPLGIPFQYGVCVPDTCTTRDVNNLLHNLLESMARLQISTDEIAHPFGDILSINTTNTEILLNIHTEENHDTESVFVCHERVPDSYRFANPTFDPTWTAAVAIAFIFIILVFVATIADIILTYMEAKHIASLKTEIVISDLPIKDEKLHGIVNESYSVANEEHDFGSNESGTIRKRKVAKDVVVEPVVTKVEKKRPKPPPMWRRVITSFSFHVNTGNVFDTHRHPAVIKSIDGIRAISMTWVIWGHTYFYAVNEMDNINKVLQSFVSPFYQHISVAIFSVDTFFTLSGFLTCYILLKKFPKDSSLFFFVKLYIHRYLRLTLVYGISILFFTGFLGRYGTGAMVHYISDRPVQICKDIWWRNILYINNIIQDCNEAGYCRVEPCFGHSWYLSNDMQFFVFGVPLMFLLYKIPVAGVVSWCCLIIMNISIMIWLGVAKDVTTIQSTYASLSGEAFRNYWNLYYQPPWSRIGPYAIGVLGGYLFTIWKKKKVVLSKWVYIALWVIFATAALALVYGKIPMEKDPEKYRGSARDVIYMTVDRLVWACCILFVMFACETNGAGFVASILHWDAWVVISKLSYVMYLLHPVIMMIAYGNQFVTPWHFSDFKGVIYYLGFCCVAFIASLLFHVGIEAPLMGLEKMVMG